MRLQTALEILNRSAELQATFPVLLACGYSPLHLATFLAAHLQARRETGRIDLQTGLFGSLLDTVASIPSRRPQAAVVMLEWSDLDPRLGLRQLSSWSPSILPDIAATVKLRLGVLSASLLQATETCRVVLCPPLLEPAPVFYTVRGQINPYAALLQFELGSFLNRIAEFGLVILDPQRLPATDRFDLKSELTTGFPFPIAFAEKAAAAAAEAILPAPPKKGLITDLDDTLWRGLLGEVGTGGVRWDLDGKAQIHGIYQTLLQSLAGAGVLIAIASKNELANVRDVFEKRDLLISSDSLFPLEVSWGPKSEAVGRILHAWNIHADSVVFVDDSPLELAEVAEAHPGITTLAFPTNDANKAWTLFGELRDLFGKERVSAEDQLRLQSLRKSSEWSEAAVAQTQNDEFLSKTEGVLEIENPVKATDARALELINKTNQFNLNGRRQTEAEWRLVISDPASLSLAVSYKDKFGPLGKIAILAGERAGSTLRLHTWVMSCRAFSRRIEHECLRHLLDGLGFERIELAFEATPRNVVLQRFLEEMQEAPNVITRESFFQTYSKLNRNFHELVYDRP
jgi:FkbH-like protein